MLSMTTMLEKPTVNVPTPAVMANVDPALSRGDMYELPKLPTDKIQAELGAVATREENQLTVIEQPNLQALNPEQFVKEAELNTAAVVDTENDDKVSKELDGFTVVDGTQEVSSADVDELPEGLDLGEPDNDEVVNQ
ncbi:MAG: hypothetical protein QG549_228 [Patescibacteria group bacterium]|nr:hypothetical protein [Patescibacteria group bacterium]